MKRTEPIVVTHDDPKREDHQKSETVLVGMMTNMDRLRWVDSQLDKQFLVFRSIERADGSRPTQEWFDSLDEDSAFALVEKALTINMTPALKKKVLDPFVAGLQKMAEAAESLRSTIPPSSSPAADTTSGTSLPTKPSDSPSPPG